LPTLNTVLPLPTLSALIATGTLRPSDSTHGDQLNHTVPSEDVEPIAYPIALRRVDRKQTLTLWPSDKRGPIGRNLAIIVRHIHIERDGGIPDENGVLMASGVKDQITRLHVEGCEVPVRVEEQAIDDVIARATRTGSEYLVSSVEDWVRHLSSLRSPARPSTS
jgi:hypothetical protein